METPIRQEAIAIARPAVPGAATRRRHRDLRHLVYRLTPVDAYDLRLVKRIGVLSITKDADLNEAYVEVIKVNATPGGVTATAKIHKATKQGTKPTQVTLRKDDDLFELSGERDVYQGWWSRTSTPPDGAPGFVEFGNGARSARARRRQRRRPAPAADDPPGRREPFREGAAAQAPAAPGTIPAADQAADPVLHRQGRQLPPRRRQVPAPGSRRSTSPSEATAEFRCARRCPTSPSSTTATSPRPRRVIPRTRRSVGTPRTPRAPSSGSCRTRRSCSSFDEPLRFIFSHSALVEGWDNPNVFTICNLQDGQVRDAQAPADRSRAPTARDGQRRALPCRRRSTSSRSIAHEEFSKFAGDLQKEIEEETGVSFAGRIFDLKKDKIKLQLKEQVLRRPDLPELWERISRKTTYQLQIRDRRRRRRGRARDQRDGAARADEVPSHQGRGRHEGRAVSLPATVATAAPWRSRAPQRLPDVVGELSRRVPLSRATIVRILKTIDNLDQVKVNPAVFIDQVERSDQPGALRPGRGGHRLSPVGRRAWTAELFKERAPGGDGRQAGVRGLGHEEHHGQGRLRLGGRSGLRASTSSSGRTSRSSSSCRAGSRSPRRSATTTPTGRSCARKTPADYLYLVRETKGTDKSRSSSGRPRVGRSSSARRTSTR